MLDSLPVTATTTSEHHSIDEKPGSVADAGLLSSQALTSAQKSQKATRKVRVNVTDASSPKQNSGLSSKTPLKGDRKKSRETKKAASQDVRKSKRSPSSDTYVEGVSTTSEPTGGAKLLDKNTADTWKTNSPDSTERKKIYAQKWAKETQAKLAC